VLSGGGNRCRYRDTNGKSREYPMPQGESILGHVNVLRALPKGHTVSQYPYFV
jgi:hypothetical protein